MEAIILFVLFAVVSSVLQGVTKNVKQQKQATFDTQAVKPKVQPTGKAINKPNISGAGNSVRKSAAPIQEPRIQTLFNRMEPEIYKEDMQNRDSRDLVMPEMEEESDSTADLAMEADITFSELQRSIIMAEVLGKPRALKKAIR